MPDSFCEALFMVTRETSRSVSRSVRARRELSLPPRIVAARSSARAVGIGERRGLPGEDEVGLLLGPLDLDPRRSP